MTAVFTITSISPYVFNILSKKIRKKNMNYCNTLWADRQAYKFCSFFSIIAFYIWHTNKIPTIKKNINQDSSLLLLVNNKVKTQALCQNNFNKKKYLIYFRVLNRKCEFISLIKSLLKSLIFLIKLIVAVNILKLETLSNFLTL